MPINFTTQVYIPTQDIFGRTITVTPLVSQPNAPAYAARGIYSTTPTDVEAEDGSIFSDTRTILDIVEAEFTVLPLQGDRIYIGPDSGLPEVGTFLVTDVDSNGGGETTLSLQRVVTTKP
jgi:hypothetical protein